MGCVDTGDFSAATEFAAQDSLLPSSGKIMLDILCLRSQLIFGALKKTWNSDVYDTGARLNTSRLCLLLLDTLASR